MPVVFRYQPPAVDPGVLIHASVEVAELAGAKALLVAALPLVPFDEGELYASGDFGRDESGGYVTFSAVDEEDGYDYAAIQHENENYDHDHGQAHYLSDPMDTAHAVVLAAMAAAVKL